MTWVLLSEEGLLALPLITILEAGLLLPLLTLRAEWSGFRVSRSQCQPGQQKSGYYTLLSVCVPGALSVYLQSHGADNNLLAQSWGEYYFVPGLACLLLWQLSFGLDSAPAQHWAVSVEVRLALTALTWSWCRLHRSAEVVAVVGGGEGRLVASLGRLWAILRCSVMLLVMRAPVPKSMQLVHSILLENRLSAPVIDNYIHHWSLPVIAGKFSNTINLSYHVLRARAFTPTSFYVRGSQVKVHPGARFRLQFRH